MPRPWRADGYTQESDPIGHVYNPRRRMEPSAQRRQEESRRGERITAVEQQNILSHLMALALHYMAAVASAVLIPPNTFVHPNEMAGQPGEQLVTMGGVLVIFDAVLRRVAEDEGGTPRPLTLTRLWNGVHEKSNSEVFDGPLRFDTKTFFGLPVAKLLEHARVRRHGAVRARRDVLVYLGALEKLTASSMLPSALGEKLDVLLEPEPPSGSPSNMNSDGRSAIFKVDSASGGMAAEDVLEKVYEELMTQCNLSSKDVTPPAYLNAGNRHLLLAAELDGSYRTYLRLSCDWDKVGMPEANHVRDMLMLFKWSLDWLPTIKMMAQNNNSSLNWGPGVLFPRNVLPGYWAEKSAGEKDAILWWMWIGRTAYQNAESVSMAPLRPTSAASAPVESLRSSLGLQHALHNIMITKEQRAADEKEVARNLQKLLPSLDRTVDEDRVLLCTNLPLTVDSGGILSEEESEQLLTLLAAPVRHTQTQPQSLHTDSAPISTHRLNPNLYTQTQPQSLHTDSACTRRLLPDEHHSSLARIARCHPARPQLFRVPCWSSPRHNSRRHAHPCPHPLLTSGSHPPLHTALGATWQASSNTSSSSPDLFKRPPASHLPTPPTL